MMPQCEAILCEETAEFLGPSENPALCQVHLQKLMERIPEVNLMKEVRRRRDAAVDIKQKKDFQVRNEPVEDTLQEIGHLIGSRMPEGWGFNFLMFNFGEGGSTFYISNAQRPDMIAAMKEFIAKQEAQS